ncbi:hypothetical protein SFRURICE_008807 [Spodoptera frugiperda]|uniref:SFRICE_019749 n=1 Tax=Spodoptera frugiperda TaxID=7108 RepID=A0A2H1W3F6_SPOFR|nr:uncharacterized protein LOC126912418 [Spodoptera frugiperda]KAF9807594.1 hypothetical protein SFRURICE_008807 [Spodoptera frugiperda]
MLRMSRDNVRQEQDQNTAKLVMSAFYKVADKDGATAAQITNFLQDKFGNVWKTNMLTTKAEETLKRSAVLGFLERRGNRYVANLARGMGCCPKKKRRRRSCCRKRCCPKRRKRRKKKCCPPRPPCCCKKP